MGGITGKDALVRGEYYMVTGEDPYHYGLTVRGDVAKALLVFYSTLAFGVDRDTFGAVERFDLNDRRYSPFYINSSGGMRICDMIRRTLVFEHEGELKILPVAPRRWLEAGKQIKVEDAGIHFGAVDLNIVSHADAGKILVDLRLHDERPDLLKKITVRVPHPSHELIRAVIVNGIRSKNFNTAEETIDLMPGASLYSIVVEY